MPKHAVAAPLRQCLLACLPPVWRPAGLPACPPVSGCVGVWVPALPCPARPRMPWRVGSPSHLLLLPPGLGRSPASISGQLLRRVHNACTHQTRGLSTRWNVPDTRVRVCVDESRRRAILALRRVVPCFLGLAQGQLVGRAVDAVPLLRLSRLDVLADHPRPRRCSSLTNRQHYVAIRFRLRMRMSEGFRLRMSDAGWSDADYT